MMITLSSSLSSHYYLFNFIIVTNLTIFKWILCYARKKQLKLKPLLNTSTCGRLEVNFLSVFLLPPHFLFGRNFFYLFISSFVVSAFELWNNNIKVLLQKLMGVENTVAKRDNAPFISLFSFKKTHSNFNLLYAHFE